MVRTKLYIGNLPENSAADELKSLFEQHGKVEECDIVKNFGFVHMATEEEAKVAIDALNNSDFMGNAITVEMSHSKVRQRAGMGGKGQCYRCGKIGHWSKECPKNPRIYKYNAHPMHPPMGYGDRPMPRYIGYPERPYGPRFGAERMRPYPDMYDRRPPLPPPSDPRDDYYYYYYRRPYDEYGYPSPGPAPPMPGGPPGMPPRYGFADDPAYE